MAGIIEAHCMGVGRIVDEGLVGVVMYNESLAPIARLKLNVEGAREVASLLIYAAHEIEANQMPPALPAGGWDPALIDLADIDLMVLADIADRGTRAFSQLGAAYQNTVIDLATMVPPVVTAVDDVVRVTEMGRNVLKLRR